MLAGLPKAPSANNPIVNPERATRRQRYIIDRMLENGFITAEQREAALKQVLHYRAPSEVAVHAEYVAEAARQMIFNQYGAEAYTRGLNVYLTLNSAEQTLAYHALRKGIMEYEQRQVYRGPEDYIDLPADRSELDARIAEALQDFPTTTSCAPPSSPRRRPKKVVAVLQNGDEVTITGEGLKPATSALVGEGQSQDTAPAPARSCASSAAARATGRSRSCPRSRAPSSPWTRAPAASAPWSAASTTRRASSTT